MSVYMYIYTCIDICIYYTCAQILNIYVLSPCISGSLSKWTNLLVLRVSA